MADFGFIPMRSATPAFVIAATESPPPIIVVPSTAATACATPIVPAANGGFRVYPVATIDRIAFIKRAQALGFSLDEVRSLLDLEDGRNRRAIQSVTQARLGQIEDKLADLHRMREALSELLHRCKQTGSMQACPIIETLAGARSPT